MIKTLYTQFQRWSEKGCVYLISDPHYMDYDMNWRIELMYPDKQFDSEEEKALTIANTLNKNINSVCHKNDTLIVLGDIGDTEFVKQLKAGHKVLIAGNHDKGLENYTHKTGQIVKPLVLEKTVNDFMKDWGYLDGPGDWYAVQSKWEDYCIECSMKQYKDSIPDYKGLAGFEYDECKEFLDIPTPWSVVFDTDNRLFDELYSGPLMVAKNIMLSHEPIMGPWVNYHGHKHRRNYPYVNGSHMTDTIHGMEYDWLGINCSCETNGFMPIDLGKSIKEGGFAKFNDIHRITIDRASNK